ncbi:MAG TPA: hypothetical protein ENN79_16855, partial [Desulfobacteraceae bacterium]|nr:hypothetical protein [Desulfobacteraceae bacterium]
MDHNDISPSTASLTRLRGVGVNRAAHLAAKEITSLHHLLHLLPLHYEDRRKVTLIGSAGDSETVVIRGTVTAKGETRSFGRRSGRFKAVVNDGTGALELLWFNYHPGYLSSLLEKGTDLLIYGKIDCSGTLPRMIHPEAAVAGGERGGDFNRIVPVYPSVPGFTPRLLRSVVNQALDSTISGLPDPVPAKVIEQLGLPSLSEALKALHRPGPGASITELNEGRSGAHRRILFDRFFS